MLLALKSCLQEGRVLSKHPKRENKGWREHLTRTSQVFTDICNSCSRASKAFFQPQLSHVHMWTDTPTHSCTHTNNKTFLKKERKEAQGGRGDVSGFLVMLSQVECNQGL